MNSRGGFRRKVLWVAAVLALTAGCAALDVRDPLPADVTQKRQERTQQAVREFESTRDLAELQAALAHWNQGDLAACEEVLQRLLDRDPNHREARLLLADLRGADDCPQAACGPVGQASADHPENAQVQHATALLLDATGQGDVALAYYERAADLEPDNELYAPGQRTALEAVQPVEASSHNATGRPGHPIEAPTDPAPVSPDPTARPVNAATALAGDGLLRPAPAAPADETRRAATTLRFAAPKKTAGYPLGGTDSADSAEAAESDGVQALIVKGRAALAEGSADEVVLHFQQAAAIHPNDPQILTTAALAALRADRPEVVVELLRPVVGAGATPLPRQAEARLYRILGLAYYRLEDYRSSEVALRQALSLDKSSALSYLLMGYTLSKLGQFESAEAHLQQARTINPRYTVRR